LEYKNKKAMKEQIEIVDYCLSKGELFAQISLPPAKPNPNFFNISFDQWDVIKAAIALKIIYQPKDSDTGRKGQELRLGYYHPAFIGEQGYEMDRMSYYSYSDIEREFSGVDREAIVLHIAMNDAQIENALLVRAI
jgi:hypothetical protein